MPLGQSTMYKSCMWSLTFIKCGVPQQIAERSSYCIVLNYCLYGTALTPFDTDSHFWSLMYWNDLQIILPSVTFSYHTNLFNTNKCIFYELNKVCKTWKYICCGAVHNRQCRERIRLWWRALNWRYISELYKYGLRNQNTGHCTISCSEVSFDLFFDLVTHFIVWPRAENTNGSMGIAKWLRVISGVRI